MLKKAVGEVALEQVSAEGAAACQIREIVTARDGAPTFAMRQFVVQPGGHTPFHAHPWEHEVYVLQGTGRLQLEGCAESLRQGDAVLVMPGEHHSFSCEGPDPLVFLCMIPVEQACCR